MDIVALLTCKAEHHGESDIHVFLSGEHRKQWDGSYLPPPAQIRTCGTTAYGSCLGYVTRSDPQGKDVHF
jgi:hypothetical protein